MSKNFKRIFSAIVLSIFVAVLFLSAVGCQQKKTYTVDELNEHGASYWSKLPFVTAEAKDAGYEGGAACQHLTFLTRGRVDKNLMFFGTDAAGMCRSADGGKSWNPCNDGLYTSGVGSIEIDPKNEKHIIVTNVSSAETSSEYTAVFYSLNGGDSWIKSDGTRGIGFAACQYYYDTLAIDDSTYDESLGYCTDVYFATPCLRDDFPSKLKNDDKYKDKRGLYKSEDGGKSFSKIEGSDILTDGIIVILDGMVAVANMNGIFVVDGDKIEKKRDMDVHSFIYVGDRYYVMTADGIYVSEDLESYTPITEGDFFKDRRPRNLAVSEKNPDRMMLYARKRADGLYSNRPYYSHDGGKTWSLGELTSGDDLFYYYTYHAGIYTFDPDDEEVIVGIIGGEVIKSADGGKTFFYYGDGVNNISVGGYYNFNVYDENLVYVGGYDFGGALTTDGGKTWKNVSLSKDGDGKDIMGGYAADENTLFGVYVDTWSPGDYFRDYRYVCFSHDGGKTVNIDPNKIIKASEYKNTTKEDVYASLKIDKSISTSYESSYQSPAKRKILFCANYRSTDNGYTWENMQDSKKGEKCLQVYTHSGKTLYGCSKESGYVLKSTDNGKTWKKVNQTELEKWTIWDGTKTRAVNAPSHITDIAIDEQNGYIYAVYYRRLYRMKLDGTEIKNCNESMVKNNFNTINIRSVAIDPNCPQVVYCCGSGDFYMDTDSVRRSCDFGESWKTLTPSASKESIIHDGSSLGYEGRCVRVRSNGEVWLGTLCLGMCKLTPPYLD